MAEIVGVRFKEVGKIYYFDPCGREYGLGCQVIVETARGVESGIVAIPNREVEDETIVKPLKKVVRTANKDDLRRMEENRQKEKRAYRICQEKIAANKLEMKLVGVEYAFDNTKILFYFTADGRVDFRELVKDLASVFRTRIELRQIGVRDEAKMLGGLGICGRPFCCSSFLGEFQPVSIKMAKEQGLSLNPTKISGTCGRLMCCLKYEQPAYEELLRTTPRAGAVVNTPEGRGVVREVTLLTGQLKVDLQASGEGVLTPFHKSEVRVIRDGSRQGGRREDPEEEKQKNTPD
ncbi:MAG: stage 0 sporulation family protein [Angelakisella sp.]|jgi:cell fate regulator YaaT (PSP1 superfamily)|nr:stage 0 sporulation family protein [Angelakisella sp.]